ncbi:MAG: hypothetical protein AAB358_01300 [Patescibacteria group bacterium]
MEDTQLYRPILKKGWQIVKKFKNLWFFGLFAALLGAGGEYEIFSRAVSNPYNEAGVIRTIWQTFKLGWQNGSILGGNIFLNIWQVIAKNPLDLIFPLLILALAIIIALFVVWLAIVSQIGLIKNVGLITKGKSPTINEGIDGAVRVFWPVFLANAALRVILALLFFILGRAVVMLGAPTWVNLIVYLILFVIFVILTFVFSFLVKYQIFYLILKNQKFTSALKSGWRLFVKNWLISIEMALVMFVIYLIAVIVTTFLAGLFVASPIILPLYVALPFWLAALIALGSIFLVIVVAILINAILNAYQWTAWTLLFMRLDGGEVLSKIVRAAQWLPTPFNRK